MKCRHCLTELTINFVDLGSSPPSNAYLTHEMLEQPELHYPLKVMVCEECWLVQTCDFAKKEELFDENYAYLSSTSESWLVHAKSYVEKMKKEYFHDKTPLVVEIAANDGYLLQYFKQKNIPCYGVEPTKSTAEIARNKGIDIFEEFFGEVFAKKLVEKKLTVDLLVANNVLAHVPDINDFVKGVKILLNPDGIATFEFPHLLKLVENCQFDTIYHEHFSYLSLLSVINIFKNNGLQVFNVEKLNTHGGSLRVYAQRLDSGNYPISTHVKQILQEEISNRMNESIFYQNFQFRVVELKNNFLNFLLDKRALNEKVVGYGAAAKGNTLLNFSGIKPDLLSYVIDRASLKQGKYMPGSRIPILKEDFLKQDKPRWIVLFPWNISQEIIEQLSYARDWGAKFVIPLPSLVIL